MKKIKVLLTACGCPGASTLIRMLKQRGCEVIGTDMDGDAIGRFLVDRFYQVPSGSNSIGYIPRMLEIVKREKPDVLLPESSNEVYPLACAKERFEELGTKVLVSDWSEVGASLNKYSMYRRLKEDGFPTPKIYSATTYKQFLSAIYELGYPDNTVVFKPHVGKGSRGVRIIDSKVNRLRHLLNEKPISKYISFEEAKAIFSRAKHFPKMLVMEYLDEPNLGQRTCDCLCMNGRELLTTVKTVEQARGGVIVKGRLVKDEGLVEQTREILRSIRLSYCVNLQFIGDKLIEINPRVSTFIYQPDLVIPYLAIKLAVGDLTESDVIEYRKDIAYGRRMIRYMDQRFW